MNYLTAPGSGKETYVSPERIINHVCRVFSLTKDELTAKNRRRRIVWPRQITMYLIDKYCELSLITIGEMFGKDHATVIHARKNVIAKMQIYARDREHVGRIRKDLDACLDVFKAEEGIKRPIMLGDLFRMNEFERNKTIAT